MFLGDTLCRNLTCVSTVEKAPFQKVLCNQVNKNPYKSFTTNQPVRQQSGFKKKKGKEDN